MNRLLFSVLLLLVGMPALWAQQVQYTTESPRIDDVNDRDVTIKRVELTSQYTIIYMKFESPEERMPGNGRTRSWPFPIPMPRGGTTEIESGSNIGFQPSSRLYVNQGERSYKFIRSENIPHETRRKVAPGERVDFVAYFERIEPGYTVFDLFECKDGGGYVCFNFWGVHITNPKKDTYAQRTPKATPRSSTPKPAPKPPYTPRTAPGLGTPGDTTTQTDVVPAPASNAIAINGTTRNARNRKPVGATLTYQLLSGAESAGDGSADSVRANNDGKYAIPIPVRGVYVVTASARGYFSQSDTLATNRIDVARDFDLIPIETGAKITLRNIYFNVSKFDLKAESFPELDRLVGVMQDNSTMQIRLEGHTDTVGDFDANVELSRNRVNEVKRYLVSKGIAAGRIETVGYGPSRPINTNKTLKERPENRRVEMVVVNV